MFAGLGAHAIHYPSVAGFDTNVVVFIRELSSRPTCAIQLTATNQPNSEVWRKAHETATDGGTDCMVGCRDSRAVRGLPDGDRASAGGWQIVSGAVTLSQKAQRYVLQPHPIRGSPCGWRIGKI